MPTGSADCAEGDTSADQGDADLAAADSPSDFVVFFRSNFAFLVRVLAVGSDHAEDAVQEAFVEAHLRWDRISTYDDPLAWVRLVAVRRLQNGNRSRGRLGGALFRLRSEPQSPPPAASDLDLAQVVQRLPLRQRIAVALFYYGDLPLKEVADAMGVSVGATKATLYAARSNLKSYLGAPRHD